MRTGCEAERRRKAAAHCTTTTWTRPTRSAFDRPDTAAPPEGPAVHDAEGTWVSNTARDVTWVTNAVTLPARRDLPELPVVLVRDDVQGAVGALPDVAHSLATIDEQMLFAGHAVGAENWALLASIVATCKLSDVNPVAYIAATLEAILNGHPQSRIEDLMPWRFRKTSSPDT